MEIGATSQLELELELEIEVELTGAGVEKAADDDGESGTAGGVDGKHNRQGADGPDGGEGLEGGTASDDANAGKQGEKPPGTAKHGVFEQLLEQQSNHGSQIQSHTSQS